MSEETPDFEGKLETKRWRSRRRFAIASFVVMVTVCVATYGTIIFGPNQPDRWDALQDTLFPVCTVFGGVIAAYMGVDAVGRLKRK